MAACSSSPRPRSRSSAGSASSRPSSAGTTRPTGSRPPGNDEGGPPGPLRGTERPSLPRVPSLLLGGLLGSCGLLGGGRLLHRAGLLVVAHPDGPPVCPTS